MLALSTSDKVFLCIAPIDFRRQINGLIKSTQAILKQNPYSRTYFVFTNKNKTAIKILHYDGIGFWMHLKRLSKGRFQWPQSSEQSLTMTPIELQVLLMNGNPAQASFQEDWAKIA
jgi:transposase